MDSVKEFESGKLTPTVTYNTCYTHSNVEPVCITFGLGATVSVNSVIGLPTLTTQKRILYLDENKASSKNMQLWFPLLFLNAYRDLPIYLFSLNTSYLVKKKQHTPSGKAFIIHQ